MVKKLFVSVLLFVFAFSLCISCSPKKKKEYVVLGGVYSIKKNDSMYTAAKVVGMNDSFISVRFYTDVFKEKPKDVDTKKMSSRVPYLNMVKESFLLYIPQFIKVEKVTSDEFQPPLSQ